jgi:ferritin-like metal-binding protein YciE
LEKSRGHEQLLEKRLEALGAGPSSLKDGLLAAGGLNWGLFFQAQSDTPAKLATFAYAYEHLKIGGYELLKRTARRAGDTETVKLCADLIAREHAMAERIAGTFDSAATATLASIEA